MLKEENNNLLEKGTTRRRIVQQMKHHYKMHLRGLELQRKIKEPKEQLQIQLSQFNHNRQDLEEHAIVQESLDNIKMKKNEVLQSENKKVSKNRCKI